MPELRPFILRCQKARSRRAPPDLLGRVYGPVRVVIRAFTMDAAIDEFREHWELHAGLVCDDPEQTGERIE